MPKPIVLLMFMGLAAAAAPALATTAAVPSGQTPPTVKAPFRKLEPLTLVIAGISSVHRDIYVETDGATIRSMFVIQREKVLPDTKFRFRYPPGPTREFRGETFLFDGFLFDEVKFIEGDPGKELDLTRKHLASLGLKSPRLWRMVRAYKVLDTDGTGEILYFMMENADETPAGSLGDRGVGALSAEDENRLFDRMVAITTP